jgi:endonuclease I
MLFGKAGAACLVGCFFVFANTSVQAEVFVNEIHYDDATAAGDVGERIEIVATAGENLSTYKVQLYNGSTPAAAVTYGTLDAVPSGSDATCGSSVRIAVLSYATNALQNGSNDGIALINGSGAVVQFLSYEGVATATNGPASGTSSVNIPVSETNSTAAGTSLQLGGTGSTYSAFTWNTSATDTFGTCNNNQVFNLGPQVNVLPSVVSTNPANGSNFEIDPPLQRSLTVTFSEPVTLLDNAAGPYSISCSLSANLMALPPRAGDPPASIQTIDVLSNSLGTPPFQVGDQCVLTIHASNFTDSDGAHPTTNTVVNFTVVLAPNAVPSVVSTTPANNAASFSGTSNFIVNFSETVQAGPGGFTLQCSVTGAVALSFPSSANVYNISKSATLHNGETCVLSVVASAVLDFAGFHLAQNTVINFTVGEPPNQAPTVVSITPSNNAVGVPIASDFRIVFNEMVKVDSESFVLQCSTSGLFTNLLQYKILEIVAGGGRAVTLASPVLLQAGETCTLTIIAQGVVDQLGLAMAQDKVVQFTIAGGNASTYYNRVNTSSSEQLRCSLNTVIRGHTVYPYSGSTTSTWDILEIADEDPNNSANILDVYRNRSYTKGSSRAGTGSGLTYNREHTWPNSLGFGTATGNLGLPHAPYTDTHMLYLSDTQYNADRGNDPYANCTLASGCGERATEVNNGSGGGSGVYPGNSNWTNGTSFQTWSKRKGDVARAVMYMAIRYEGGTHTITGQNEPDLELTDNRSLIVGTSSSPAYMGLLTDLLQWHQADPPDAAELARNQVIYSFQGNRNPFIDHPEWATAALFNSAKPASCTLNTASFNHQKNKGRVPVPGRPSPNIR